MKRPSHAALPAPMHGTAKLARLPGSGKAAVAFSILKISQNLMLVIAPVLAYAPPRQ
jgi:hypothetical protein